MQSELKSLSKIFTEVILRIPDYQRGYSWQEKHLKDFWSDLIQLTDGKNHYTGVLTFEPVNEDDYKKWDDDTWIIKSKLYAPLYVVDGQQRLTTAIVLMQCILESIGDDDTLNYTSKADIKKKYIFESKDKGISRSYIFGYEKDNPSYEYLKRSIYGENSENHALPESTIYTANLEAAKSFFLAELKPLTIKEIETLYTRLTQHLQFNIFYIEPELDVFVTFETMNNRGKPLSHLELLKNRLIYLSTRFAEDHSEQERVRRNINESWKTIYHYLGKRSSRVLSDDLFLQTHFLAYFGPQLPKEDKDDPDNSNYDVDRFVRTDEKYKNYLLEEIFTVRRLYTEDAGERLTVAELDHYAQDIKKTVEQYYQLFEPGAGTFPDREKILLEQLTRTKRRDVRLLSLIVEQVIKEPERREALLTSLERCAFLSQLRPYHFRELPLRQFAIKLKAVGMEPEEVIRKIESNCKQFTESKDFNEAIKSIGKNDGYYGWVGLRYFMYEYEQHLRTQSKTSRQLLDWDSFQQETFDSDHKTIEHIYPQKATDTYWKDAFAKYSIPERNVLRNSLGNLLPVSHAKNASLSNRGFAVKKGSAANPVGYSYGCLSEIQVSHQTDWTAPHIAGRGIFLLDFMEQRWNVNFGSDEKKIDLLGLAFVLNKEALNIANLRSRYAPNPVKPAS